jgi:hypothetical protein
MNMRRATILLVFLVGCGGGQKTASTAGSTGTSASGPDSSQEWSGSTDEGAAVISPETYDQMRLFFRGKQRIVEKCYANAVHSGKLSKKAGGTITFTMQIKKSGSADRVEVSDSALKSPDVEDCMAKMIKSWALPEPEHEFSFSYSYSFMGE